MSRMPAPDRVEALIRDFASQLQELIREQLSMDVTAAVQASLGGAPARRGKGAKNGAVRAPSRDKGGKRTPEEIEKIAARLLTYISSNPGQRSEQIAAATKISTGELALPIKRLLADKKVKASGKARGTTYAATK
jgi:hypothetical protein